LVWGPGVQSGVEIQCFKVHAGSAILIRRLELIAHPHETAQQINMAFGVDIDKDVVRRVLAKYYHLKSGGNGPSWLTFIGHMKDSLWSVDLFRGESILLRSHWVVVVMDQYTRHIVGFGAHSGYVDGVTLCCMFNKIISRKQPPQRISSDNDPLFLYQRWQANL
jgi:putative transposase